MNEGVAVTIGTMMTVIGPPLLLLRARLLMRVMVTRLVEIVIGTVRHQHSRAGRKRFRTAQLQESS